MHSRYQLPASANDDTAARASHPRGQRQLDESARGRPRLRANIEFVRALNYGAASADAEIQAILARSARRHEDRIISVLAQHGITVTPALRVAARGWLLMTRHLAVDWLETREISRDELRNLCARTGLQMLLGSEAWRGMV